MDNILTAEHITKDFTKHRALDDVSIAVPRGKVYGLLSLIFILRAGSLLPPGSALMCDPGKV